MSSSDAPASSRKLRRSDRTSSLSPTAAPARRARPNVDIASPRCPSPRRNPRIASRSNRLSRTRDPATSPAPNIPRTPRSCRPGRAGSASSRPVVVTGGGRCSSRSLTLVEHRVYAGRVLPGVEVDGVASAGASRGHPSTTVSPASASTLAQAPVRVRIGTYELSASPSLLELTVDARATARAAIDGRSPRQPVQPGSPAPSCAGSAPTTCTSGSTTTRTASRACSTVGPPRPTTGRSRAAYGSTAPGSCAIEPHTGTGIVRRPSPSRARQRCSPARTRPVLDLPVGTLRPRVDARAVDGRRDPRARPARRRTSRSWSARHRSSLTPEQLAGALGTRIVGHQSEVTLDPARLHAALGSPLSRLEQLPVDAQFAVTAIRTPCASCPRTTGTRST